MLELKEKTVRDWKELLTSGLHGGMQRKLNNAPVRSASADVGRCARTVFLRAPQLSHNTPYIRWAVGGTVGSIQIGPQRPARNPVHVYMNVGGKGLNLHHPHCTLICTLHIVHPRCPHSVRLEEVGERAR